MMVLALDQASTIAAVTLAEDTRRECAQPRQTHSSAPAILTRNLLYKPPATNLE